MLAVSVVRLCHAAGIAGTWHFDKAMDFDFPTRKIQTVAPPYIQATSSQLFIPPACAIKLEKTAYYPGGPFQSMLKEGDEEAAIGKFLLGEFSIDLSKVKSYFETERDRSGCNKIASTLVLDGDRLVGIFAGSSFFGYSRERAAATSNGAGAVLNGLRLSQLPFYPQGLASLCPDLRPGKDGKLGQPEQCAPVYYPAVASASSKQPLAALVGSHHYAEHGARGANVDYDNPVANGLHPVFFVLPPMKDVVLIRVEDFEADEDNRDAMSGVYLSVKNGKVVDQLNEGCDFDPQYICRDDGNHVKYRLETSGKFTKLE
jgi:hypothetical protein